MRHNKYTGYKRGAVAKIARRGFHKGKIREAGTSMQLRHAHRTIWADWTDVYSQLNSILIQPTTDDSIGETFLGNNTIFRNADSIG